MMTEKMITLLKTVLAIGIVSMMGSADSMTVNMALVDAKHRLLDIGTKLWATAYILYEVTTNSMKKWVAEMPTVFHGSVKFFQK